MVTIEEIYQKYFDCPVPFRKSGRLTTTGAKANEKLFLLLQSLEETNIVVDARIAMCYINKLSGYGISEKQEMINDLWRFVTDERECYALKVPVTVYFGKCPFHIRFLSRDTDYDDVFLHEVEWKEDADNSVLTLFDLSDDDVRKVFEAVLCQEIEDGWEWMEHARSFLKDKFPDEEYDEAIDAFVCENWQNMKTDAWNYESFLNSL